MATRKSTNPPAPELPLTGFLSNPDHRQLSTAEYIERGASAVTERDVAAIMPLLELIELRLARTDSARLRARAQLFAQYLRETEKEPMSDGSARPAVAFALAYFLWGSDRIPDETPRYGLLDDALVFAAVLERNGAALREHWRRAGREWSEES